MTRIFTQRRSILRAAIVLALTPWTLSNAQADGQDMWSGLHRDYFDGRQIAEGDNVVQLDVPERADDPALVPIKIRIPSTYSGGIRTITVVIDRNPSPIAAVFKFGAAVGHSGERSIATRVRMDRELPVRAIVETDDGQLHMAVKTVNAAGGCASVASKNPDSTSNAIGDVRVRVFSPAPGSTWLPEAQVMIKHPNNNGMQRDPTSGEYIPIMFIQEITAVSGQEIVFKMESSISISANPNLRFTFQPSLDQEIDIEAVDTTGARFTGRYPAARP